MHFCDPVIAFQCKGKSENFYAAPEDEKPEQNREKRASFPQSVVIEMTNGTNAVHQSSDESEKGNRWHLISDLLHANI